MLRRQLDKLSGSVLASANVLISGCKRRVRPLPPPCLHYGTRRGNISIENSEEKEEDSRARNGSVGARGDILEEQIITAREMKIWGHHHHH